MKSKERRISRSKNPKSKRYRRDMAKYLSGKRLKCVTARDENSVENVIGRGGDMLAADKEFSIFSSGERIFRCRVDDLDAWELLSLDGVVITAPDLDHDGEMRTVIAYYEYWRHVEQ